MNRRKLMILLGGAATWPLAGRAQQKAMPVIGILGVASPTDSIAGVLAAFRQGLGETGFVEGQNVAIEYRWAYNNNDRLPALAAELVALKVGVIVTEGGTPSAVSAKNATATIPIVFHAGDAIADGIVANLARPGGNLTGVSLFAPESLAKRFQLLCELVPQAKVIALLSIPNSLVPIHALPEIQEAARAKGVQLQILNATTDSEIDAAYATLGHQRAAAVVLAAGTYADKLVALAARHAVPAAYNQRPFATAGGLLIFGPSIPAAYVIKGTYTGKILKGEKPADLPVQQSTRFELVINLQTAKALGLTVPQTLLARADEVIE
jgi:putative tryptophan/tyrosine transport system substrate-binding protein